MKFLKMFSEMDNHQMKLNKETSFVDIKKIYGYTIEHNVRNCDNQFVGISIVCRSTNNIHYAAPPLNYDELVRDLQGLTYYKTYEPSTFKGEKELKEKTELYQNHMKNIETFIPFMIKAFKLAEDGTILQIVIKNDEWELEEVE